MSVTRRSCIMEICTIPGLIPAWYPYFCSPSASLLKHRGLSKPSPVSSPVQRRDRKVQPGSISFTQYHYCERAQLIRPTCTHSLLNQRAVGFTELIKYTAQQQNSLTYPIEAAQDYVRATVDRFLVLRLPGRHGGEPLQGNVLPEGMPAERPLRRHLDQERRAMSSLPPTASQCRA